MRDHLLICWRWTRRPCQERSRADEVGSYKCRVGSLCFESDILPISDFLHWFWLMKGIANKNFYLDCQAYGCPLHFALKVSDLCTPPWRDHRPVPTWVSSCARSCLGREGTCTRRRSSPLPLLSHCVFPSSLFLHVLLSAPMAGKRTDKTDWTDPGTCGSQLTHVDKWSAFLFFPWIIRAIVSLLLSGQVSRNGSPLWRALKDGFCCKCFEASEWSGQIILKASVRAPLVLFLNHLHPLGRG